MGSPAKGSGGWRGVGLRQNIKLWEEREKLPAMKPIGLNRNVNHTWSYYTL